MKFKLHFQRFEMKYQIPMHLIDGLMPELLKYMEFDQYTKSWPDHAYEVHSLYYDSAGLDCYYQKLAGVKIRKKLRIRFYNLDLNQETTVFLEIKKKFDTIVIKDRFALTYQDCYQLLNYNKIPEHFLADNDKKESLNEFLWLKSYNSMRPQNIVSYKRKALISKIDPDFRVTFDYDIKTYPAEWLTNRKNPLAVNPGGAILEVKFNNVMPAWFHQIIQRYNLEQRPFSKYCSALEVCQPQLVNAVSEQNRFYQN